MALLTAHQVCKSYPERGLILKGLSCSVEAGQSVAMLGSNGSGKSTFLRSIVKLVEIDSGSIEVFDTQLSELRSRRLRSMRSKVGFIFQYHNLVPRLSALTNVIHGKLGSSSSPRLWRQSLASSSMRRAALDLLDRVGLANFASQPVGKLSGGQAQRVAIARALMQEPRLILADEPVASLDPSAGTEVMELFVELARADDIAILFTTHNVEHAKHYSDKVIGLQDGVITFTCAPDELKDQDLGAFYDSR